ncbi:MAG: enoyl-CoA hydratase/isomerase family protein [Halobacteriota archaeon]|nr:enoyl-CoA hydratase/isomerase family protein [Halobacteriota archaeon]
MDKEPVVTKIEDQIMTISLNRPEKRNAINADIMDALPAAFSIAAFDQKVKAVVLRGEGPVFSAGIDLMGMGIFSKSSSGETKNFVKAMSSGDLGAFRSYLDDMHYTLNKIESLEKPVICAINKYAAGMGLEVALAADFRIATEDALLGMPEVQLGLIPDVGGTTRLTRMLGIVKAKELILTGKMITAEEAYRLNLINEVVPPEKLMESAENLARYIVDNCSPLAVGMAKKLIDLGTDMDKNTLLGAEGVFNSILISRTEDVMEGFMARVQKRRPNFKGR